MTSKIFRTAFSSVSSTAPEMPNPALLTRTSIRPARFTTSPIESNTFSRSDTSVFMLSMPSAGVLDKLNTRYPFSENFFAMAFPIPWDAPVITATFIIHL